jgi:hypothetical protein
VAARTLESAALAAVVLGLAAGVLGSAGLGLGLGAVGPGSAGLAAVVLGLGLALALGLALGSVALGRSVASNPSTLIAASAAIRSRDC